MLSSVCVKFSSVAVVALNAVMPPACRLSITAGLSQLLTLRLSITTASR